MRYAIPILILLFSASAYAQDETKKTELVTDTKKTEETKTEAPASQPVKEIVGGVKEVINKAKELKAGEDELGNKVSKLLGIFALLAAIFKLMISLLKVISGFFKTGTGKTVIRISTVVLGFLTFLVTNLAMKMPWYEALWLALSGPGALMIHELSLVIPWLKNLKEASKE